MHWSRKHFCFNASLRLSRSYFPSVSWEQCHHLPPSLVGFTNAVDRVENGGPQSRTHFSHDLMSFKVLTHWCPLKSLNKLQSIIMIKHHWISIIRSYQISLKTNDSNPHKPREYPEPVGCWPCWDLPGHSNRPRTGSPLIAEPRRGLTRWRLPWAGAGPHGILGVVAPP